MISFALLAGSRGPQCVENAINERNNNIWIESMPKEVESYITAKIKLRSW